MTFTLFSKDFGILFVGVFQCGPASLAAILNGKCDFSYDAPFIFAEVNADIVQWGREPNGEWKIINVNKTGLVDHVLLLI